MRDRVLLIDGSAIVFRAFYALPETLQTSAGLPTNAAFGFATALRKVLRGRAPSRAAVIFDAPGPTFRTAIDPAYKADRPPVPSALGQQFPLAERLSTAHGLPVLRVPGVEADDVIGTLARQAEARDHDVVIVSGDKDFCQLISDRIVVFEPLGETTRDLAWLQRRWGVRPEQFPTLLGLLGDKVDNIPGVPGIGAKGAAGLLAEWSDLDAMLDDLDALPTRARNALTKHAEQARRSVDLATIRTHVDLPVPLDDLQPTEVPADDRNALFQELEFYSLLDGPREAPPMDVEPVDLHDAAASELLVDGAALHLLVDGPPTDVRPLTLAISTSEGTGTVAFDRPIPAPVRAWLADPTVRKVCWNLRDTRTVLLRHGLELRGVVGDIGLASFLLDPTAAMPHDHAEVVRRTLQRPPTELKQVLGRGQTAADLTPAVRRRVAATQVDDVRQAWDVLRAALEGVGATALHDDIELPLSSVLADVQRTGIRVDKTILTGLQVEFERRRDALEAQIHTHAGHPFNPGSPKQLAQVLFEELELPVIKRTKTGYSTNAEVLQRLVPEHPIAALVLRWRELAKLVSTYTRVLLDAVEPADGRVHCTFQQTASVSGRLICTDPDLQRTPIRTLDGRRIREAFVPREGGVLISADWSQIELRILAHLSEDPELLAAFTEGADVHRRTAARIFDLAEDAVSDDQRRVGKTVNFATIYGQGPTALAQQIGTDLGEAKRLIGRYFERYAGVRRWLDETIATARETGWCETLFGRRRIIRELSSRNPRTRAYGERIAANTPIQGTAADLCKRAMLAIAHDLEPLRGQMVLQIHDELLFDVPPDEVERVTAIARQRMETVHPLRVPLVVDVGQGRSWFEAH